MRLDLALLMRLAFLISTVSAFFPYAPPWLQEIEASEHLDSAGAAKSVVANGIAFEVKRRSRNPLRSLAQEAAWQASLISHKYDHVGASRFSEDGSSLAKRGNANQYSVMGAVDPAQSRTAGVSQDGADYSYFIQAQIGSERKNMYMLIDTGAGSSWVMGADCTSDACPRHNTFGPGESNTLQVSPENFTIHYGSGSVRGTLANDTLRVADMSLTYQFGLASNTSEDFIHFAFDGILGLSMNGGANENFLQALADSKLVDKNMFCVALSRASDGANHGEIRFGSPNPTRYAGDIGYTQIADPGNDWAIMLGDMGFDGARAGVGNMLAYIDTGTSYIFGPPEPVKALHALIPGAESHDGTTYTVPCDLDKPVVITFSGVDYDISPRDWISPRDSSGNCTSNVYGYEAVTGAWLVGDTFLKNVYAVFDKDKRRIGFAKRTDSPSNGTTTMQASPGSAASSTWPGGKAAAETQAGKHSSAGAALSHGGRRSLVVCILLYIMLA